MKPDAFIIKCFGKTRWQAGAKIPNCVDVKRHIPKNELCQQP